MYDGFPARAREVKTPGDPCELCLRRVKLFRDRQCRRCFFGSRQQALELTDSAEDAEDEDRRADYRHTLSKNRREV